jgi:hypothetical protein
MQCARIRNARAIRIFGNHAPRVLIVGGEYGLAAMLSSKPP